MIRLDAATRAVRPVSRARHWFLFVATTLVFSFLFVNSAWVVDDAYITFRTVDNLLSGHGLTWNIGERVQAYTHPLWMFLLTAAVALTGEFFKTSLVLSYVVCLGAIALAFRGLRPDAHRILVFVLLFLTSKSVIDYCSSGLENPLSYVFVILFYSIYLADAGTASRRLPGWLYLVATLSYLNRQDTILLYLPALFHVLWVEWRERRWQALVTLVVATSPALLWLLFSTFYYGFPYPNTAAAKMITAELPLLQRLERGGTYFLLAIRWDALGFLAIVWGLLIALRRSAWRALLALVAVVIYLAYVWTTASAATHMAGRFFAVPFVLGFFVAARLVSRADATAAAAAVIVAYTAVNPVASWKLGTSWYQTLPRSLDGYIDTVWFAHREGTGLRTRGGANVPAVNVCLEDGERFRNTPERVRVGGCGGGDPIGFFAFAAGPDKWIIDPLGLSDPLLARLRPCVDFADDGWRPGHFRREVPAGYVESIRSGSNEVQDPRVAEYNNALRRIVEGPLWSAERMQTILRMNLGQYDHLLDGYNGEVAMRARVGRCRL